MASNTNTRAIMQKRRIANLRKLHLRPFVTTTQGMGETYEKFNKAANSLTLMGEYYNHYHHINTTTTTTNPHH